MLRRRHTNQRIPEIGRVAAWLVLIVLTLVGVAAVALPFLFQARAVRSRIENMAASALKDETGLDVTLRIDRALWPPGVLVRDIAVASTTPGKPAVRVGEGRVTLQPFALLSGRVVINSIELVAPEIDLELVDGKPVNLPLKIKEHGPSGPKAKQIEPPFRVVAISGAKVKLSNRMTGFEPMAIDLAGIDFDVDVGGEGSPVYDIRLHKATGAIHTSHLQVNAWPLPDRFAADPTPGIPKAKKPPFPAFLMADDDAICNIAIGARITDAPTSTDLELHHVELDGRLDDDPRPGAAPSCAPGATRDDRVVSLRLNDFDFDMPKAHGISPKLKMGVTGGRLRVRVPAFLAYRYVKFEPIDGWIAIDLDSLGMIDFNDPIAGIMKASATGTIEGHDLRLAQFHFGTLLRGDIALKAPMVLTSQKIDLDYGGGAVTLSDVEVKLAPQPFAKKKMPIRANVTIKDLRSPA